MVMTLVPLSQKNPFGNSLHPFLFFSGPQVPSEILPLKKQLSESLNPKLCVLV
jgi:hypothetical protein